MVSFIEHCVVSEIWTKYKPAGRLDLVESYLTGVGTGGKNGIVVQLMK